jgi:hypothetical protein
LIFAGPADSVGRASTVFETRASSSDEYFFWVREV